MNRFDILSFVCNYDTRNVDFIHHDEVEEMGLGPKKRNDCCCHNCFYGLSELAYELLKYKNE